MRKVILDAAVTLDGFIEGPNGELDWIAADEAIDFGDILSGILENTDMIFYGRVSYDKWGNYHPGENASPKIKNAYDLLNSKTKYVFSTNKQSGDGKAIFIHSNIKEKVLEIKQQPGKNIWLFGGGKLITTFMNLGLVDEFRLAVHPVILGSGIPLFKDIKERLNLTLIEAKPPKAGVLMLHYAVQASR